MPRKRSEIWNHFTPEENRAAKCGYCNKTLSLLGGSTGNLMRHLRLKHPDLEIQVGQGIVLEQAQMDAGSLNLKPEINIEMGEDEVVECITSQSPDMKTPVISAVQSVRKRKHPESSISSTGRESTSIKTSMAYEDLVKLVCSSARQGTASEDSYDLIGRNVATKLRSMEVTQKAIAERLIGEILFQGQMEMLAINTAITTPNSNSLTTGTPLRSIVINAASAIATRRDTQEQTKTTYIIAPHDTSES